MTILYVNEKAWLEWAFSPSYKGERASLLDTIKHIVLKKGSFETVDLWQNYELTPPRVIENWEVTGYPKDMYVEDMIEEGIIPDDFWDKYDIHLKEN